MKKFTFSRLQIRLGFLLLLAVMPAIGLMTWESLQERNQARNEARSEAIQLARLMAGNYQDLVAKTRQLLSILVRMPQQWRGGECESFLASLLNSQPNFANFAVADLKGNLICSSKPIKQPVNVADRWYFVRTLETTNFVVGDLQVGRVMNTPVIVFSYPIIDTDSGRIEAVMLASVSLAWMNELAASTNLPPGSTFTVVDSANRIWARYPDGAAWVGRVVPEYPLFESLRNQDAEEETVDALGLDGVWKLFAFARLSGIPASGSVYVGVGIPAEVAYADADGMLARSGSALLVFTLLVLSVGFWSSQTLVLRPFEALLTGIVKLKNGDYSARVPVDSRLHEVAVLASGFNEMTQTLQTRQAEAEKYVQHIARLNRVYAVLSGINGAILRIRDKDLLLNEACRIAVEQGAFQSAWIGLLDQHGRDLGLAACVGLTESLAARASIRLGEEVSDDNDFIRAVLREGRRFVFNRIDNDLESKPWREQLLASGCRAWAVFPLRIEGHIIGVFNFCASEFGVFDDDELRLLEEVAADTALGLEYIEKERKLHRLAFYDILTGLPSRGVFEDRLQQALLRAQHDGFCVAAMVLKIQGLKQINSTHGVHLGDKALVKVATMIQDAVRDTDTVTRLSGNEFGILMPDLADPGDAASIVQKIIARFPVRVSVQDQEAFVTGCVGVALYPTDGDLSEILLKHAQLALYGLSGGKRNAYRFYTPEINALALERNSIEQQIYQALQKNEFRLYYQPVVELKNRRIVGMEALLRWENPVLGNVPPDKFIHIAEDVDLIAPLSEWVMETALRQAKDWSARKSPAPTLAVNISMKHFEQQNFLERMLDIMNKAGVDFGHLRFAVELTESAIMEKPCNTNEILQKLREIGLLVYIDDFGTGYSSLSYLKQLSVDVLKIDKSFVRDIGFAAGDTGLVQSVIALAHGLDLKTIAEGVETEEQCAVLQQIGCDMAQGYLFGKPMPQQEAQRLLLGD